MERDMAVVAITGITGLAGWHVAQALTSAGHVVIGISRRADARWEGQEIRTVADLSDGKAMTSALQGSDIVFHFADRADRRSYTKQNVGEAAAALAAIREAAAANGSSRIVAASSVYAERSAGGDDYYAQSKRAMEAAGLAESPGSPAILLRLPPLYGPGARGAVGRIARAIHRGWPLPLGLAHAPRRFLSLDALADLCLRFTELNDRDFAGAAGQIWYPSSKDRASLAALAQALGNGRERLLPVPGVDRLIGGRVEGAQLAREQDALHAAIKWQARN
jgi:UDP-glucose 4-epimerase